MEIENIVESAMREFKQANYHEALNYLDEALVQDPDNDSIHDLYKRLIAYELNRKYSKRSKKFEINHSSQFIKEVEKCLKASDNSEEDTLIAPTDKYLAAGVHIGTKTKTPTTLRWIRKETEYGLHVLKLEETDSWLRLAARFLRYLKPNE
ncbi:MAG: hypothetical protein EU544_03705, partial [Promethearchaeota archaeon]